MYVPKISTLYDPKLCASVTETARQMARELEKTRRSLENANVVSIVANGDTFRTSSRRQAEMMMQVKYGHKWKIGSEFADYMKALQMLGLTDIYQSGNKKPGWLRKRICDNRTVYTGRPVNTAV